MRGRGDADAEEVAEDGSGQVVGQGEQGGLATGVGGQVMAAEFGREGGGRAVGVGGVAGEEPSGGRGGAADGGFLAGVFGLPAQVSSVILESGMPYRSIRAPAARTSSMSRGRVSSHKQCCR
ncbi:hypothetical protein ADK70_15050 [Streptomyces rimosus subsp. pseudoverticillatus]|nr:hypothetical protein ADK70_15050 [Streptomyces rimosus subsp. pseudoverticillatus]